MRGTILSISLLAFGLLLSLGGPGRAEPEKYNPQLELPEGLEPADWEKIRTGIAASPAALLGAPPVQEAYLKANAPTRVEDRFGFALAVSGNTILVGVSREDSSSTGINSVPNDNATDAGAAYVFVREGSTWVQQAYLKPAAVGLTQLDDRFGFSVALSGDTAVVTAPQEDSSSTGINSVPNENAEDAGAVYVFVRSGSTWTQQAYLKPAAVGGTQAGDYLGWESVAISGDTIVVGALWEDSGSTGVNSVADEVSVNSGAAYVFVRSGTTWSQQAYLKPAAVGLSQAGDIFGYGVDVAGDIAVIGAFYEDSGSTGINSVANEAALDSGAATFSSAADRRGASRPISSRRPSAPPKPATRWAARSRSPARRWWSAPARRPSSSPSPSFSPTASKAAIPTPGPRPRPEGPPGSSCVRGMRRSVRGRAGDRGRRR